MSATGTTTEDLKQKLAQHIDAARRKLDVLKSDIEGMHEEDMQALRAKQAEINKRIEEQKDRAQKLLADIANWKEERVAHTQEAIASWRQKREIKKLQTRADRAEEFALDLVAVAAFDFEEAERAVLDAVAARFDAEAASPA